MQWFRAEICKLTLEAFHIPQRLATSFSLHRYLPPTHSLAHFGFTVSKWPDPSTTQNIPSAILLSLVEAWLTPHGPASLLLYCFNLQQSEPPGQNFMWASHLYMQLFSSSSDISQAQQMWTFHIWIHSLPQLLNSTLIAKLALHPLFLTSENGPTIHLGCHAKIRRSSLTVISSLSPRTYMSPNSVDSGS